MVIFKKPLLACMPTWAWCSCGFHTDNCRVLAPVGSWSQIQLLICPKGPETVLGSCRTALSIKPVVGRWPRIRQKRRETQRGVTIPVNVRFPSYLSLESLHPS